MRKFISNNRVQIVFGMIVAGLFYLRINRTHFDLPFILSDRPETIEAIFVDWDCDCPKWLSVHHYTEQTGYEAKKEDCFYIEPATDNIKLPEELIFSSRTRIRLKGMFYIDEGIPASHITTGQLKPRHGRVFRYEHFDILSN